MSRILLNVGRETPKLPGFVHLAPGPDADLPWDADRPLPFPDGSVGGIVCDHVLERLPRPGALALLRECRRVLRRDGVLRVATPDLGAVLERIGEGWLERPTVAEDDLPWVRSRAEYLNAELRGEGRHWTYDAEDLEALARAAGLVPLGRDGAASALPELGAVTGGPRTLVLELAPRARFAGSGADAPLVSILVPAYRPTFLRECLDSALGQTYANVEVLVSDDCPTDAVRREMEAYLDHPRLHYARNPVRGGLESHLFLLSRASGEYVKFLCDDDVLLPSCVERMAEVLAARPEVTLVTSHRQQVDARGAFLPDIAATRRIVAADAVVAGENVAEVLLATKLNFIGEPSTPMFRRADVQHLRPHAFSMAGVEVRFECDVALWASLLSQGDFVYLTDTLSLFRRHGEQAQLQPDSLEIAQAEAPSMLRHAKRMGFFTRGAPQGLAARPLHPGNEAACDPRVFHPDAAPVELGGGREVRLLCIPDWRDPRWTRTVLPFLRAFSAEDPVSLVVRVEPPMQGPLHVAVAALQAAMAEAGVAEDAAPDLILEASEIAPDARGGLYTAATALLPADGPDRERIVREARACGLPVVAAEAPEALAAAVASLLESLAAPASVPALLG